MTGPGSGVAANMGFNKILQDAGTMRGQASLGGKGGRAAEEQGLTPNKIAFFEALAELGQDFATMKDIPNARVRDLAKMQDVVGITGNNNAAVMMLNQLRQLLQQSGQSESRSSDAAIVSATSTSNSSNMTNVNISNTGPNWAVSRDGAPGRLPNINPGYVGTRA